MAKRFTDTEKWKDEWYLSLDNDYRIVWQYLLDNCSIAGIMKKNFKLLNFCCNVNLNENKLLEIFNSRVWDCGEYYFIPKFIKFQYPKGLHSEKPAIISVRNELTDKGLLNENLEIINKSLNNGCKTIKDKDKDMVIDTDIEKDKDKGEKLKSFPEILKEKFINYYQLNKSVPYVWESIDDKHLGLLMKKGRELKFNTEDALKFFDFLFDKATAIQDDKFLAGISVSFLNSQFNKYINYIQNGYKQKSNKLTANDRDRIAIEQIAKYNEKLNAEVRS